MHNNKKNEELQSRREFFKKAAKGALPILGAFILAGSPVLAKAIEEKPMGCGNTCEGGCTGGCAGTCSGACRGGCSATCSGSCTSQSS